MFKPKLSSRSTGDLSFSMTAGGAIDCLTSNSTVGYNITGAQCKHFNWLVLTLTGIYMIIGQILVINLLIAIFR